MPKRRLRKPKFVLKCWEPLNSSSSYRNQIDSLVARELPNQTNLAEFRGVVAAPKPYCRNGLEKRSIIFSGQLVAVLGNGE